MHGHQVYSTYLAFKQHFTNPKFDFFEYNGKVKVKEETYQQSRVFWFCETLARKHSDQEIKEFMLASFVAAEDPSKIWPGAIQRDGHSLHMVWKKRQESLLYIVSEDLKRLADVMETKQLTFNELFASLGTTPITWKLYNKQQLTLETLIILDMILGFMNQWDNDMKDPLWERTSFKIKRYKPFLSIPTNKYTKLLQEVFL